MQQNDLQKEWARYKYLIMSKDQMLYLKLRSMFKNPVEKQQFYIQISQARALPFSQKDEINAFSHIWGYFKSQATAAEKNNYLTILNDFNVTTAKQFLYDLALKYQNQYILASYYFDINNIK